MTSLSENKGDVEETTFYSGTLLWLSAIGLNFHGEKVIPFRTNTFMNCCQKAHNYRISIFIQATWLLIAIIILKLGCHKNFRTTLYHLNKYHSGNNGRLSVYRLIKPPNPRDEIFIGQAGEYFTFIINRLLISDVDTVAASKFPHIHTSLCSGRLQIEITQSFIPVFT